MEKLPLCRICLVQNVPMFVVADKNLQEIYEKLTEISFMTDDSRPMVACSFCYTKLKQCRQLQRKCLKAQELFNQLLCDDYEPDTPLIYPGQLEYFGGLTTSLIEHISIVDDWQMELFAAGEDISDRDGTPNDDNNLSCNTVQLKEEQKTTSNHDYMEKKKEQLNGAPNAMKPTLNIPRTNQDVTRKVKQEKKLLSTSKLIRTKQYHTANSDTKCQKPTKIRNLQKHSRKHTDEKPYKCHVCQKPFSQGAYLKRHLQTHTGEKPYKCVVCQRGFRSKYLLNIHFRVHTGEKPYKCQFCQKRFSQNSHLKHHVLTHTGEKPYECDACQCSYRTKAYLDSHIRIHTGEKPYKCDTCQRGFNIKSNLNKHVRIHTGEKPYKCDVCQRGFAQKHALNIHVRNKHTGEKPYKCDKCLRSFSAMNVLKNHLITHSGEKPYKCDVCQRSFNRKANLENHVLIHSDEKQYQCEICAKCFRQASTLKSHLWVHKKEKQ